MDVAGKESVCPLLKLRLFAFYEHTGCSASDRYSRPLSGYVLLAEFGKGRMFLIFNYKLKCTKRYWTEYFTRGEKNPANCATIFLVITSGPEL